MADRALRRFRDRLARDGAWSAIRKALRDHLYRSSDSVVMEVDPRTIRFGAARPTPGLTFAVLRAHDEVPPLCPFLAHRRGDLAGMLTAGKIGVFVLRDGVAVGCAWLALSDHHDARVREFYPVVPGEAYHYSWLLDPAERTRGTALIFVRWTLQWLRAEDIVRAFGVIDRDNRASYRIHQHFGYREAGMLVRHFHLFHVRWTLMSRYQGELGLTDPRRGRRPA